MSQVITWKRPPLYEKQYDAVYDPARYSLIEASTKSGKTVGTLVWIIERSMLGKAGQNRWWVAPSYGQSRIAYRRAKRGLDPSLYEANESELSLTLLNGAVIGFKSGEKPDNLYGEDVYDVVIDEASRLREEAWFAVRSTLSATEGHARLIGNVKGRKNWFYRMARKAEAGEKGMAYHRIVSADAVAAGILSDFEVADAKRQLPLNVFRELYEAVPSDDEGNPFGVQAIQSCIAPLSEADPVGWGWDLAKSEDWTVGIALDSGGHTCRFERYQKPWRETIDSIDASVGTDAALVDSTGVGDPIVETLQRLYRGSYEAFHFSSQSKQKLMEGLAVAIQRREITYPDGPIVAELESFQFVYTKNGVKYEAMAGDHDDCVIALGLAVKKCLHVEREAEATLPKRRVMEAF